MRVVFDTNVLVSALLFEDSTPAQAFFFAVVKGAVLISTALIEEVHRVIHRPKFDRYIDDSQREDFILSLVETGDGDLLSLNPFREITILNPQAFLKRFAS